MQYEKTDYQYKDLNLVQVKIGLIFAFRWDGMGRLGMIKELLRFVQVRRKTRDDVAWNQITEGEDEAINSKGGEAKVECVDKMHHHEGDNDSKDG